MKDFNYSTNENEQNNKYLHKNLDNLKKLIHKKNTRKSSIYDDIVERIQEKEKYFDAFVLPDTSIVIS